MVLYQNGSHGTKVKQIQTQLKKFGYYEGAIDGIYGSGTESAVKVFQRAEGLTVDGIVGPGTWQHLFENEEEQLSTILDEPLAYRTLALTGSFETGKPPPDCFGRVSGDFDGQGISFGALQWNLGQGTLQPMLKEMNEQQADEMQNIFGEHLPELRQMLETSQGEQIEWAQSIQDIDNYVLDEPWQGYFNRLGKCKSFQQLEVEAARKLYDEAVALAKNYNLSTERGVALMFDIKVQNGSISDFTKQLIQEEFAKLPEAEDEVARLCIIANLRSEASNPRWIEDVRTRKLTIATGRGTVHGIHYVLDEEYAIRLKEVNNKNIN